MRYNNQQRHSHALLRTAAAVVAALLLWTCFSGFTAPQAPAVAAAKTFTDNFLYCTADDFVALRAKPSASSTELARIPHGEKMGYLKQKSGSWYYVQYGSKKGYVYDKYVSFDKNAVSNTYYCTAEDFVSLRAKASSSSKELAKIPRGSSMKYMNLQSGKWFYVKYNSLYGYVHGDYISTTYPNDKLLYCTADDFVSLRTKATASSKELAKIPRGSSMRYLNKKSGKWYYVSYGGKSGYVHGNFVSFTKPGTSTLYCTADDFVSLRASATASSKELAKIPRGYSMTYLNKKSGKWLYVSYNGKTGYVHGNYVSFTKPSTSTLYCTADDFVSLRASATASSKELAKIPRGYSMTYLNKTVGKWYYVSYNGKTGYVHGNYVSFTKP